MSTHLPAGKLPSELLNQLLERLPTQDARVRLGPGTGLDCAVIEAGAEWWVIKSDPITFATDEIGWYLVQVNANDIATTGGTPRWLMVTLLLPDQPGNLGLAEQIAMQLSAACRQIGVVVIGGHTEITSDLKRPIAMGTMIGTVNPQDLVTPRGAAAGDRVVMTKSVPIEATAILAREFKDRLSRSLSGEEIQAAQQFLYQPGISVLRDARLACAAGKVSAMHDPTEGGIATALWELAEASQKTIKIDSRRIPIHPLSARICQEMGIDPLAAISSGALLLAAPAGETQSIIDRLVENGIPAVEIGQVEEGPPTLLDWASGELKFLPKPARDEIARVFSENG